MHNMEYEASELKDFTTPSSPKKEYPYGLKLSLTKKELDKLGFLSAPGVGEKFMVLAMAEVVEVGKNSEDDLHVCMQIKEMEVKKEKKEDKPEKVLYGE